MHQVQVMPPFIYYYCIIIISHVFFSKYLGAKNCHNGKHNFLECYHHYELKFETVPPVEVADRATA